MESISRSPDTRANKSSSHHLFIDPFFPSYFSFLKLSRRESLTSSCRKRLKEGARQRLFRPHQLTMSMGITFGNRSSTHTPTHSGATHSHNTSFSDASIKPHRREPCPLLSNCHAEIFPFTYKWPGVMLCHIMFHGQITCPISQSALQFLSPLIATTKNHDCRKRGTLCHCSEMPPWIKPQGSRGNLRQRNMHRHGFSGGNGGKHQATQGVITRSDISLVDQGWYGAAEKLQFGVSCF